MLRAAFDLGVDTHLLDPRVQFPDDVIEEFLTLRPLLRDRTDQFVVRIRIGIAQAQVLQFPLDLIDTETVCKRRVDIAGLQRDRLLALRTLVLHGTHIVEAVRKFNQDHADILGHRQEHLTHVLRLLLFT